MNNRQSRGKSRQQSRSSELQIFKLNLKTDAETNQQNNQNIQDVGNNLKEVAENEGTESSSCVAGSGSDGAHANCVAEPDETDQKTATKPAQTLSSKSSAARLSESDSEIAEKSDKSETPAACVDSDSVTNE